MPKRTAIRARNISKRYGTVRALADVSAEFQPGEVHAVLGENGAGKSTLMGVLAGFVVPDSGSIELEGAAFPVGQPYATRGLGISMVHQHFMLVPQFTVEENLALAQITSLFSLSKVPARAARALEIAKDLGWQIDPHAKVRDLPVGVQQRIEILKALADDASIVIFDEPTAVLSAEEVEDLFRVIRKLKDEGRTIILIAHKLAEVMAIADRVTVLRRGEFIATAELDGTVSTEQLAAWMVGEMAAPTDRDPRNLDSSQQVVRAEGITARGDRGEVAVRGVGFSIRAGEILGFGGVDGNGQVELAEVLAGVRRFEGTLTAPDAVYVPQDRQVDGLALGMSIRENLWIAGHDREALTSGPFLRLGGLRAWADALVEHFGIKIGSISDPVSSLSGGNQQKVVVARSLDRNPEFLIVVNPTRGLDLKATIFVHEQIRAAARSGAAVALFSTDRDELDALSDRKVYLSAGSLFETMESALVGVA